MAKRFYAVQVGDSVDCSSGSTRKRDAYRMARAEAKQYPGEEVRICLCTEDDDFCEGVIILQESAEDNYSSTPTASGTYYDLF